MFGEQVEAQEWLSEHGGHDPDVEQQRRPEVQAYQEHDRIEGDHGARFGPHLGQTLRRHIAVAAPARGVRPERLEMPQPDRKSGDVNDVLAHGFRLWKGQFGIVLGILGVAVVGEMEIAEPVRRERNGEAAESRHRVIQPLRLKSRPVHRLVQQGEQEHDENALRQHQHRPVRYPCRDQGAEDDDRTEMTGELEQARPVRLAGQSPALLIRQRGDHVAMVDRVVAVDCVHAD